MVENGSGGGDQNESWTKRLFKRRPPTRRRDPRQGRLMFQGGTIGLLLLGAAGFLFGYFVYLQVAPGQGYLTDARAAGLAFGWFGAIAGALVGAQTGNQLYRQIRRQEHQARQIARSAAQLARYEAEKGDAVETAPVTPGHSSRRRKKVHPLIAFFRPKKKKRVQPEWEMWESPWP